MEKRIYLAGGCFWGVEAYYSKLKGVIATRVGYANGSMENPTYKEVCTQNTGHAETVEIIYDQSILSLETLLMHFLRFVDPYSVNRQGNDIGTQYRSGVYCEDDADLIKAKDYFDTHLSKGYAIEIRKIECFFEAEEYHQDYLEKNPNGYCHVNLNLLRENERK